MKTFFFNHVCASVCEAFDNRNVKLQVRTFITSRPEWLRFAFIHEATSIRQVQIKFPRDSAAIFHAILRITRIPYDT